MSGILSCMNPEGLVLFSKDDNANDNTNIPLAVKGQCVFAFDVQPDQTTACFEVYDKDMTDGLRIFLNETSVIIKRIGSKDGYFDQDNCSGISQVDGVYYWLSLDAQNQRLFVGLGESRIDTQIYHYQFPMDDPKVCEENKRFLESLSKLSVSDLSVSPLYILKDPIDVCVPLIIKNTNHLTMDDIAKGTYLPDVNLPTVARQLYGCVSGKKFILDNESFPEFSNAIEHSIATPGCWCYETLQKKKNEFNPAEPNIKETYLRITMGDNDGESPGIPYVLEIWPVGHYSPIHNHAGADAIIRVLHGKINVSLYPFLSDEPDKVPPFGVVDFEKGDITWLSGHLNQIHKLKNLDTNNQTCITIQCYMYSKSDDKHYDYFDYISSDGHIAQYEPDSDADFVFFQQKMREEWDTYTNENTVHTNCCYGCGDGH